MNNFDLTDEQIHFINIVLSNEKCVEKAVVFGSRAKGNFKPYSDIDLVLFGGLTSTDAERIKLILEELPIIYVFDVLTYNDIKNPALKEHIDRIGKEIYKKTL